MFFHFRINVVWTCVFPMTYCLWLIPFMLQTILISSISNLFSLSYLLSVLPLSLTFVVQVPLSVASLVLLKHYLLLYMCHCLFLPHITIPLLHFTSFKSYSLIRYPWILHVHSILNFLYSLKSLIFHTLGFKI